MSSAVVKTKEGQQLGAWPKSISEDAVRKVPSHQVLKEERKMFMWMLLSNESLLIKASLMFGSI